MKLTNKKPIFRISLNALFLAMYIGLAFLSIRLQPVFEFTLKGFSIVLSAIFFGPIDAIAIGAGGELICQFIPIINPYGITPTVPLWLIPQILRGLIVGLLFKEKDPAKHKVLWIITMIVSCLVVTASTTLITYIDALIMEYSHGLTALKILFKFINSVAVAFIFTFAVPVVTESLKHTKFIEKDSD